MSFRRKKSSRIVQPGARIVYADESGNFDFSRKEGATRFFSLVTLTCEEDDALARELRDLRTKLAQENENLPVGFHAVNDPRPLRSRVFDVLQQHSIRIDATLLEKPKAQPHIRRSQERFYKFAWYYHMRHLAPRLQTDDRNLLVVAATLGTRKKKKGAAGAVTAVMNQVAPGTAQTASWNASSDYCLQAADYCSWAIFRKWEHGDASWYRRIQSSIHTEFDLFRSGNTEYY